MGERSKILIYQSTACLLLAFALKERGIEHKHYVDQAIKLTELAMKLEEEEQTQEFIFKGAA